MLLGWNGRALLTRSLRNSHISAFGLATTSFILEIRVCTSEVHCTFFMAVCFSPFVPFWRAQPSQDTTASTRRLAGRTQPTFSDRFVGMSEDAFSLQGNQHVQLRDLQDLGQSSPRHVVAKPGVRHGTEAGWRRRFESNESITSAVLGPLQPSHIVASRKSQRHSKQSMHRSRGPSVPGDDVAEMSTNSGDEKLRTSTAAELLAKKARGDKLDGRQWLFLLLEDSSSSVSALMLGRVMWAFLFAYATSTALETVSTITQHTGAETWIILRYIFNAAVRLESTNGAARHALVCILHTHAHSDRVYTESRAKYVVLVVLAFECVTPESRLAVPSPRIWHRTVLNRGSPSHCVLLPHLDARAARSVHLAW